MLPAELAGGAAPSSISLSEEVLPGAVGCKGAAGGLWVLIWSCDDRGSVSVGDGESFRVAVDREDWGGGEFIDIWRVDLLFLSLRKLEPLNGDSGIVESVALPVRRWVFSSLVSSPVGKLGPLSPGDELRLCASDAEPPDEALVSLSETSRLEDFFKVDF